MAPHTNAPADHSHPRRPAKTVSSQSLNHLLNFTLPPRQQPPTSLPRRSRKTGSHAVWNKERFVNAQYRFVLNPTGDYTVHFADPDIYFQWHDILQVLIPRSSVLAASGSEQASEEGITTCPICLSSPTAPRMTKCGHVFCFPCILHYLSLSNDLKWARCPICFDSVNERQLKCVKWYDGPSINEEDQGPPVAGTSSSATFDSNGPAVPKAGSLMRMRLMQRPQITTLSLPRSQTWPSDLIPPHQAPFHFLPDVYHFAKFMLATPDYLVADLSSDLDALAVERRMMASMRDELSVSFIDSADAKLRLQIAKASALDTAPLREAIDKATREQTEIERRFSLETRRRQAMAEQESALGGAPDAFLATQRSGGIDLSSGTSATPSQASPSVAPTASPSSGRNSRQRRNVNPPPPTTQTYYYYQAGSGLPLFLHPLDIKILFSHFNSYALFPNEITIKVEMAVEGTVNDDLRKRCKYIAHMPEGANVAFIEADLEGVVGAEGLKNFENALKLRKTRRKEKGRRDDRARARAEEKERERMNASSWSSSWSQPAISFPQQLETFTTEVETEDHSEQPAPPPVSGAWGDRSFASTLHSASTGRSNPPHRATPELADEWDIDAAWHELEQRGSGGGNNNRKKKNTRLVVLGSGGGGRRR